MIEARDDSLAGPALSVTELLGDAAAPRLTYVEGDIHSRCGAWTESQWRPAPCGCGAEALAADHEVGELDFTDGAMPGPVGCSCHLAYEDRATWFAAEADMAEAPASWPPQAGSVFDAHRLAGARVVAPQEPAYVDIYFSAGQRRNWNEIADDIIDPARRSPSPMGYRSCDDGNERSCEIWRVRWHFATGMATAKAEKVFGREEFGVEDWYPLSFTRPAVSPDGRFLAYAWREWTSRNTFHDQGRFAVRIRELDGSILHDHDVAWPLPWGGGVGWPAWLDDETLVVGNEMSMAWGDPYDDAGGTTRTWREFDASFKTVQQVPLSENALGKHADGNAFPIRGPGVPYESLNYVPNPAESQAIREMRVATDPHAHANAKYGHGDRRGPRVASFGNRHDEALGEAATTEVFDPTLDDPLGELGESFRKPSEIYDTDDTAGGLHHPTWNITGDMVQAAHQETKVAITDWLARRGLYGFTWSVAEEEWVPWNHRPWNDKQGRLFPNGGWSEFYDSDPWWEGLPGTLEAGSEGLPELPKPVISDATEGEHRCAIYVWKYGAFCGSDDYLVAQFACVNPPWATTQFRTEIDDSAESGPAEEAVEHLAQLTSRVVLIRLSDGFHWDLTSLVEAELFGDGPRPDGFEVFGLYPTCGALVGHIDA